MNASCRSCWILDVAVTLALAACTAPVTVLPAPTPKTAVPPTASAVLPNPASIYCEQQGNRLEIRTAPDGGQSGSCIFPDGSECDEWAYYRGECGPGGVTPAPALTAAPAEVTAAGATALPTLEGGYAGWPTYVQADYGFEFRYPPDWVVVPDDNPVSALYGHALFVGPADNAAQTHLRIVFRRSGEDLLLWPTGAGDGEFVERDTVAFMGGWLRRVVLVCRAKDIAVWYRDQQGAEIRHDHVEFSFILATLGTCAAGEGLSPNLQVIANMIVSSCEMSTPAGAP